jgi:hypothetical protein
MAEPLSPDEVAVLRVLRTRMLARHIAADVYDLRDHEVNYQDTAKVSGVLRRLRGRRLVRSEPGRTLTFWDRSDDGVRALAAYENLAVPGDQDAPSTSA